MSWSRETQGIVGIVILAVVLLGTLAWMASTTESLRQYEVTLGDGTKATCVVVQGYRSAAVNCVPHVVLGSDAEDIEVK